MNGQRIRNGSDSQFLLIEQAVFTVELSVFTRLVLCSIPDWNSSIDQSSPVSKPWNFLTYSIEVIYYWTITSTEITCIRLIF